MGEGEPHFANFIRISPKKLCKFFWRLHRRKENDENLCKGSSVETTPNRKTRFKCKRKQFCKTSFSDPRPSSPHFLFANRKVKVYTDFRAAFNKFVSFGTFETANRYTRLVLLSKPLPSCPHLTTKSLHDTLATMANFLINWRT